MKETNIFDKNGKKIREGDLIAISDDKEPWMRIEWNDHHKRFTTEHIVNGPHTLFLPEQAHAGRSWEVVGNINPELSLFT